MVRVESRTNVKEFVMKILPNRRQMAIIAERAARRMRDRIFPPNSVGRTPSLEPFPPYKVYRLYVPKTATPPPVGGRSTGKSVRYEHGWGGGPDSYRAGLGLTTGRLKNLRLTGKTAEGLQGFGVTGTLGIITFTRDTYRLAERLERKYGFFGLSAEEKKAILDDLRWVIRENTAHR